MNVRLRQFWLIALLLAATGCGGSVAATKVNGSVTYDGKPIDDGYIVFRPADGKGGEIGGPIISGKYALAVPSGPKVVIVSNSTPVAAKPLTSEEASKLKGPTAKQPDMIDPSAKGNGAKVDVSGPEQTHDFALKSPS